VATASPPALFALELLPGERVHAEMQASGKGITVRLAQFLVVPLLLFAMFGGFFVIPQPPNPHPEPVAGKQLDPAAIERAKEHEAAVDLWQGRILVWLGTGLGAMAALGLADQWLRVRNARYLITSERVAIQGGGFTRTLIVLDLDRILSVHASATWLERRFGLINIELRQAGVTVVPNGFRWVTTGGWNVLAFLDASSPVLSQLLNHWLPRDGRATTTTA
jgi:hypothetical protein